MNDLSPDANRIKRDGCDCPEYVERCAHQPEGTRLVLGQCSGRHTANCPNACPSTWHVWLVPIGAYPSTCVCSEDAWGFVYLLGQAAPHFYRGDSFPAALAAFHEAEARLLGRAE